jgi:putative NIF3 family GTP cyclohydrolase 1 type 2
VKYLVTVVQGITVEADSPADAEAHGLAMVDGGFAETIAVEVEPLGERKPEK